MTGMDFYTNMNKKKFFIPNEKKLSINWKNLKFPSDGSYKDYLEGFPNHLGDIFEHAVERIQEILQHGVGHFVVSMVLSVQTGSGHIKEQCGEVVDQTYAGKNKCILWYCLCAKHLWTSLKD